MAYWKSGAVLLLTTGAALAMSQASGQLRPGELKPDAGTTVERSPANSPMATQSPSATFTATAKIQGPPGIIQAGGCYPPLTAAGRALGQESAKNEAKANWSDGGGGNLSHAVNEKMTCEREPDSHAIRRWMCVYTAEPCPGGGGIGTGPTGPTCQARVSVEGDSGKVQSWAENHATTRWMKVAGDTYGNEYKYWPKANNKDLSCRHNGLKGLGRRWRCVASGDPCQSA